ncbi:hypothetical protein FA13DRAFT_1712265 [Coprinellus micaceus]|uniref:Uncharacterized protein n=1 Tax=Coprinellus micaceus TaxID=71717 RepID=A0A4Y7T141_COPMI|nr:hypothetical protein FA13DRAFT_1712265 [Coprinellus micaceus]
MDAAQGSHKSHTLRRRLNPFKPRKSAPEVAVGTNHAVNGKSKSEPRFRVPWMRAGSRRVATGTVQSEPRGVGVDAADVDVDEPPIHTMRVGVVEELDMRNRLPFPPPSEQHELSIDSSYLPQPPPSPPPSPPRPVSTTTVRTHQLPNPNDTTSQFLGIFQGAQNVSVQNISITIASGIGTTVALENPTIRYSMRKHIPNRHWSRREQMAQVVQRLRALPNLRTLSRPRRRKRSKWRSYETNSTKFGHEIQAAASHTACYPQGREANTKNTRLDLDNAESDRGLVATQWRSSLCFKMLTATCASLPARDINGHLNGKPRTSHSSFTPLGSSSEQSSIGLTRPATAMSITLLEKMGLPMNYLSAHPPESAHVQDTLSRVTRRNAQLESRINRRKRGGRIANPQTQVQQESGPGARAIRTPMPPPSPSLVSPRKLTLDKETPDVGIPRRYRDRRRPDPKPSRILGTARR